MRMKRYNFNGKVITLPYTYKDEDGNTISTSSEKWLLEHGGTEYSAPSLTDEQLAANAEAERVANINSQIASLQSQLADTDYKVIKCSEAQLAGEALPYDIATLHSERQSLRDQINALELKLNS